MKKYLLWIKFCVFIIFLVIACTTKEKTINLYKPEIIQAPVELKASFKGWTRSADNKPAFIIKTSLTNCSLSNIVYLNFSPCWDEAFLTDKEDLKIQYMFCFQNWYFKISLIPFSKEEKELIITPDYSFISLQTTFKIGFHFCQILGNENINKKIEQFKSHSNIIWSNPVKITPDSPKFSK